VIALNPGDAARVMELHEAAVKAQKALDDFDEHIREKYLRESSECKGSGLCLYSTKRGWETGIEYSEDWQFIVPATPKAAAVPYWGCSSLTLNPAIVAPTSNDGGPLNDLALSVR
jgi:hypothetical protein